MGAAALLMAAGCGGGGSVTRLSSGTATGAPATTASADLIVNEAFPIPGRPYALSTKCWGGGSPTIILEPGEGDGASTLRKMFAVETMQAFAELGTVCVYDHAGIGASGPVKPGRRRTIGDLSSDLHRLLGQADLPAPLVIVGNSFGGDLAMDFVSRYPANVKAVVLLDVPPPNPKLSWKDVGGGSWRDNEDLLDVVSVEHSLARHPPELGSIPLRAVLAEDSDTTFASQSFWLDSTTHGVTAKIPGDHGLFYSDPLGVIDQVTLAVRSASS